MDIPGISQRPNAEGTSLDTAAPSLPAPPRHTNPPPPIPSPSSIHTPAATQQLSTGSLLLSLLQAFESTHPGRAQDFLREVATKLRSVAAEGSVLAPGLNAWAAKFEAAAESGEPSNLFPSVRPPAHFGIHAYQVAQQTAEDPAVTDAMVGHRVPPAGSAPAAGTLDALSSELIRIATESLRTAGRPEYAAYVGPRGELAKRMRRRRLRRHRGRRWRNRE